MVKQILAALVILTAQTLWAAAPSASSTGKISEQGSAESALGTQKSLLSVDGFSLMLGGIGIGFDRVISPKASVGVYGTSLKLKASDSQENSMKLQSLGIRGRYFWTGESTAQGWYAGLALSSVDLDTKVKNSLTGEETSASDKKSGFLGSAGYQISGRNIGQGKMIINLAILSGIGMGGSYEAKSSATGTRLNTSIESGLGAEATLGLLF
jgi:hypothetical protein